MRSSIWRRKGAGMRRSRKWSMQSGIQKISHTLEQLFLEDSNNENPRGGCSNNTKYHSTFLPIAIKLINFHGFQMSMNSPNNSQK